MSQHQMYYDVVNYDTYSISIRNISLIWGEGVSVFLNFMWNCVTQLKLDTVEKLSSTIFCCLCVSEASVSPDQISTFSNIYRHTSPLLTQYNLILSSTELYWPSTTMYQPVPPHTDPVPPNIKQYQLILIKYQPVSSYTDPVPSGTTYNKSSRKAQFSQLEKFSFYDSFDESRIVYLV